MSEYFVERDGRKRGPYAEALLHAAYAQRQLLPTDLVWTKGMPKWLPAAQVFGDAAPPPLAAQSPSPSAATADASPYRPPAARVAEPTDERDFAYAGFWVRFGALLLDSLVVMLAMMVFGGVVGGVVGGLAGDAATAGAAVGALIQLVVILASWLYFALMESGERGATLGKRAFHLRVVSAADQERISFARATGRYFARWVSMLVLYIGYLMQPFTARKQALHDMIAGTVVVSVAPASRTLIVAAIALGLMIPGAGILAAIAIPAYSDYTVRAKISEALITGAAARTAVAEHVAARGELPRSLDDAGYRFQPNPSVSGIALDPRTGALTVTVAFKPVEGKTIQLVPSRGEGNTLTWSCRPGTIPRKYLPAACRGT